MRLRDLEDALLGFVEDFLDGALARLVRVADDAGGRIDQTAQQRALTHDARVVLDVGRGGHDIEQLADVGHAAHAVELIGFRELLDERDRVDHLAALEEAGHAAEDAAVRLAVEHGVVDDFHGLGHGIAIDQHAAEHADLGFRRVRRLAFRCREDGSARIKSAHRTPCERAGGLPTPCGSCADCAAGTPDGT